MIQTKEELFIADLGGDPQQKIELSYGAKIKITDLLSKYLEDINHKHCCKSDSEQLFAVLRYAMPDQFTDITIKNIVKGFEEQNK